MTRLIIAAALAAWAGLTLLLSGTAWGQQLSLAERLRPHVPGNASRRSAGWLSGDAAHHAFGPLASAIGARFAKLVGVDEDLAIRLRRVHDPMDATSFRLRQVGAGAASLGAAIALTLVVPMPRLFIALLLVGAPIGAFLVIEQQLSTRSARWQRRLFLEAPVVAEQLAMHLTSGASLVGALSRSADRGSGAIATDLQGVLLRIRQGHTERAALEEWAAIAKVPALSRLISVLALAGDATDLGRIVAEEARSLRREIHRELISAIESRNQQVWIPVTVSALIPGVIVLAVPFLSAVEGFAS
jgi:tight adherence protein C